MSADSAYNGAARDPVARAPNAPSARPKVNTRSMPKRSTIRAMVIIPPINPSAYSAVAKAACDGLAPAS